MKPLNNNSQKIGNTCAVILFGALALATTVACSDGPKTAKASSKRPVETAQSLGSQPLAPVAPKLEAVAEKSVEKRVAVERPKSDLMTFKSRDYGVSFQYPWQYAYLNAKTVATGDDSLKPKTDGSDAQFTLARVEIPKGYYPDTNFDSAYFTLSLNQDLGEDACYSTLGQDKDKLQTANINGVDFRWTESNSGGHGSASKVRNYVAFANGNCYELESGLKTQNDKGLSREVNPDQVMSKLDSILNTVSVEPDETAPVEKTAEAAPVAQN
jgi:hypothetical protein